MQVNSIDPIILGHNQFFGVDHLSSTKGAEKERYFSDLENILELIRYSLGLNVRGLMLSTHPKAPLIADGLKGDSELKNKLNAYVLLPYISKYIRKSNEKGIINVIFDTLSGAGFAQKFRIMFSGGKGLIKKDIFKLLETLIDVELLPLKGLNIRAIFLHDVLTDLAVGLDLKNIFELYIQHVVEDYGAIPAFATKNLPLLMEKFAEYGIRCPLVLVRLNKLGFEMNPSRQACEEALEKYNVRIMAMGTLASGHLKPDEAYKYLFTLPKIESTVVGVSTRAHAKETFGIIKSYIQPKLQ